MKMKMEVEKKLSTKIHSHDTLQYHIWKSRIILSTFVCLCVCLFSFLLYLVKSDKFVLSIESHIMHQKCMSTKGNCL